MSRCRGHASIVYWNTGFGIARDAGIVQSVLESRGFRVRHVQTASRWDKRERVVKFFLQGWRLLYPYRLQVHLEQIHREQFRLARHNLIFPNPEFTDPGVLPRTPRLDAICCKTRHAVELMKPHFAECVHTGFTSEDRFREGCSKSFRRFFHLAGKSDFKGTDAVISAWRRHPEWPELTIIWSPLDSYGNPRRRLEAPANVKVVTERVSENQLLELQNACGVHLCPSKTEGFGHYIMEALSTGALVITTDAPPMNELVPADIGYLASAEEGGSHFMSTLYDVQVPALEACIEKILTTSQNELQNRSRLAREWYLRNDAAFRERLGSVLDTIDPRPAEKQ